MLLPTTVTIAPRWCRRAGAAALVPSRWCRRAGAVALVPPRWVAGAVTVAAACVVAWVKRLMHLASAAPRRMACPAWSASLPACLAALAAFLMLPAL
jgi:hypothetical protein